MLVMMPSAPLMIVLNAADAVMKYSKALALGQIFAADMLRQSKRSHS